MSAKTVENKINAVWKNICRKRDIPKHMERSFVTTNSDLPNFYHLVKTHKLNQGIRIRPIVSNTNGPTKRISWLLTRVFRPMLNEVPAHLQNSMELIDIISSRNRAANVEFPYPFSLDVTSLYTSVPIQEAIENIIDRVGNNTTYSLTAADLEELLTVTLTNTFFTFKSNIYLQIQGLPMGSSISGILAIVFLDRLEKMTVMQDLRINPYTRYVDDAYLQTTNEEQADEIHKNMNQLHPCIKFEIEKPTETPEGNKISLLDFSVTITKDGDSTFEFYKKKAKKPLFANNKSALPRQLKINMVKNERNRINKTCSSEQDKIHHNKELDKILRSNGYPQRVIETSYDYKPRNRITDNTEWLYFPIPYISDAIDNRIKRIFQKEGIPIRLVHKSFTLRQALKPRKKLDGCKKSDCPTSEKGLCFLKDVVYRITCNKCKEIYIGSTIRKLHDRIKEHLNTNKSSVYKHLTACKSSYQNIQVKIITRDNDNVNLRLKEAFHIRKEKPKINSREEYAELADLLL